MEGVDVYFSLGSNMGDRRENIFEAVRLMEKAFSVSASAVSEILETAPWGFVPGEEAENEGRFYNAVVRFRLPSAGQDAYLHAHAVLALCKQVERRMGRVERPLYDHQGKRQYFSRPIDIDILFYGREKIVSKQLIVPHLGISERDFVMIPLRQVAKSDLMQAFPLIFN